MLDFSLSEEHQQLIEMAHRFTTERIVPNASRWDDESVFPMDVFKEAWELGLINPTCPADYGGLGLGELENALICEELAYGCT
ncbi:MAG: acyl-CoA dehydrogenase family protein, partial [Polyangiaceae bacterium]